MDRGIFPLPAADTSEKDFKKLLAQVLQSGYVLAEKNIIILKIVGKIFKIQLEF